MRFSVEEILVDSRLTQKNFMVVKIGRLLTKQPMAVNSVKRSLDFSSC